MLPLTLGALGVVYGDIGTSPLYAVREAFLAGGLEVTRTHTLGVVSLVVWALVVVVSIKYLGVVLRADNHGEGGLLALTALIAPPRRADADPRLRLLLLIGLFGTALLYGDGIITPAISVLSAVEGLEVAAPGLERLVVPAAVVILVGLFTIQHRGTGRIGAVFGPVMLVWFTVLGVVGVAGIARHPSVLAALDPRYGVELIVAAPAAGLLALGGVFLVVTGSEALYADMGHFGRRPIRLGWYGLVFPALLLTYLGQGALLVEDPTAIANPFYRMVPAWAVLPATGLATIATIIASQALISGAFSLTMQAVQLGDLPRVRIEHTSRLHAGQVYVPVVNWLLMAACVATVIGFGSSTALAGAYGIAVTTTMVITTVLLAVLARTRWRWPVWAVASVCGGFLVVDLTFLSANLPKIPAGGWFPLLVGGAVFTVMTTWRRGRELVAARLRADELPIERFIASVAANPQPRVPGTAVYLTGQIGATPPALLTTLKHHGVLHETILLVTVRVEDVPTVPPARRATIHDLGEGFLQVVLHFGFAEPPDVPRALAAITRPGFAFRAETATYIIGRERVVPTPLPGMSPWRERLFAFLHRNAASAADFFHLPPDRVEEVGRPVEI